MNSKNFEILFGNNCYPAYLFDYPAYLLDYPAYLFDYPAYLLDYPAYLLDSYVFKFHNNLLGEVSRAIADSKQIIHVRLPFFRPIAIELKNSLEILYLVII